MSFEDFKHAMDKWAFVFLEDRDLPLLKMLDSIWHKLMAIRLRAATAIGHPLTPYGQKSISPKCSPS